MLQLQEGYYKKINWVILKLKKKLNKCQCVEYNETGGEEMNHESGR